MDLYPDKETAYWNSNDKLISLFLQEKVFPLNCSNSSIVGHMSKIGSEDWNNMMNIIVKEESFSNFS